MMRSRRQIQTYNAELASPLSNRIPTVAQPLQDCGVRSG